MDVCLRTVKAATLSDPLPLLSFEILDFIEVVCAVHKLDLFSFILLLDLSIEGSDFVIGSQWLRSITGDSEKADVNEMFF